jgi:hypothetical protein
MLAGDLEWYVVDKASGAACAAAPYCRCLAIVANEAFQRQRGHAQEFSQIKANTSNTETKRQTEIAQRRKQIVPARRTCTCCTEADINPPATNDRNRLKPARQLGFLDSEGRKVPLVGAGLVASRGAQFVHELTPQ